MRAALCHQSILFGDAIGHDIFGMRGVLERLGYDVEFIGEFASEEARTRGRVIPPAEADMTRYDLVLYHHSILWREGEELILNRYAGPTVLRYHNITPAHYFTPFAAIYVEHCQQGRTQTQRFAERYPKTLWLADSGFNQDDLVASGVPAQHIRVVPPFHQVNAVSTAQSRTETGAIHGLFVGRYAPNKGHEHLIKVACAARKILPVPLHVRMVGTRDAVLQGYLDWLDALIRELDVSDVVRLDGRLTEADLNVAFEEADVFVCMSEHEGFCVPIVEAQARGLPVVASACAAVVETAGANQAILPIPKIPTDYAWYARACLDAVRHQPFRRALTEAGYRNFYNRFAPDRIEIAFAEALAPVLQRHLS